MSSHLSKRLDGLPVSANALRVLIVLLARGADTQKVKMSRLELGRLAFQHESTTLKTEALRKRGAGAIRELEARGVLKVTDVVVGRGRGAASYRVDLQGGEPTERQQVTEVPKTPPRGSQGAADRGSATLKDLLSPKARRSLPPGFKLPSEG